MRKRSGKRKNIFILGLDSFYREEVEAVLHPEDYAMHGLLSLNQVTQVEGLRFDTLLEDARGQLNRFDGDIDGIVAHWDFPSTELKAILCAERGLPSASLEAVLKCGHKYWSRCEQARHVPEATPRFCMVNPFAGDPASTVDIDYPYWLKPVKSYSSKLGFHITSKKDFDAAIEILRKKIHLLGDPFNEALARADLPQDMKAIDGCHCLAEAYIEGLNVAPEGHVHDGEIRVHGVVNMVQDPGRESYGRCEYPSQIPQAVQNRMIKITKRLMSGIGYDNDCFNIEFFWDEATDDIKIIEVNPRISRAHSNLFHQVDGESNHEIALSVAIGEAPHFQYGKGPHAIAGDFWWRVYEDAAVIAVPTQADIDRVQERFPDVRVKIHAKEGQPLSSVQNQDSYSYVIADIMAGAEDRERMVEKYHQVQEMLPFEFEKKQEPGERKAAR